MQKNSVDFNSKNKKLRLNTRKSLLAGFQNGTEIDKQFSSFIQLSLIKKQINLKDSQRHFSKTTKTCKFIYLLSFLPNLKQSFFDFFSKQTTFIYLFDPHISSYRNLYLNTFETILDSICLFCLYTIQRKHLIFFNFNSYSWKIYFQATFLLLIFLIDFEKILKKHLMENLFRNNSRHNIKIPTHKPTPKM